MVYLKHVKTAAIAAAFAFSQSASAGLIQFDTCIAACDTLGSDFSDNQVSLANLSYADNNTGGVDFTLTNTVFAHSDTHRKGFLTDLFLDFQVTPDGFANASDNIDSILIDTDAFSASGQLFDTKLNFAHRGPRIGDRILNDGVATWTLTGISEEEILGNSIVIVQRLSLPGGDGYGAARLLGSAEQWDQQGPGGDNAQSVPEPGIAALLGFGLCAIGWRRRKQLLGQNDPA